MRTLRRGVWIDAKLYTDPEALQEVLTPDQRAYLHSLGILEGDGWFAVSTKEPLPPPVTEPPPETELPPGFPGRFELIKHGFTTIERIRAATDVALRAVPSVGEATLKKIRQATT